MATEDKYDRQIRIWGSDGQAKLNNSSVICLGLSPAGTETLKNLVLPGIGEIVIVTDQKVEKRDLGRNFFVDPEDIGKPLGDVCLANLLEMNPDVKGTFILQSPESYFKENSEKLKKFNLIIIDQKNFDFCREVSKYCVKENIALAVLKTNGFIAYLRLFTNCYTSNLFFLTFQLARQKRTAKNQI